MRFVRDLVALGLASSCFEIAGWKYCWKEKRKSLGSCSKYKFRFFPNVVRIFPRCLCPKWPPDGQDLPPGSENTKDVVFLQWQCIGCRIVTDGANAFGNGSIAGTCRDRQNIAPGTSDRYQWKGFCWEYRPSPCLILQSLADLQHATVPSRMPSWIEERGRTSCARDSCQSRRKQQSQKRRWFLFSMSKRFATG